jgi:hypothetical protein
MELEDDMPATTVVTDEDDATFANVNTEEEEA